MRVSNHETHARQSGDFLRGTLGVAAGDDDAGAGLRAMDAADGLAKLVVGGRRDGTGVQDDEIGVGQRSGGTETARSEAGFQRGPIGLGSAASECLYEITRQAAFLTSLV